MKIVLAGALLLLTTGCVVAIGGDGGHHDGRQADNAWKERQQHNASAIDRLVLLRSQSSVESEFGEPDFHDSFMRDGEVFEVLFYRTHRNRDDGMTSRDETTPLVFVDGQLVGWGHSALDLATP
ncbi:MAG: DUF3192 domain-containing protein [Pseudomonadota bacterium]